MLEPVIKVVELEEVLQTMYEMLDLHEDLDVVAETLTDNDLWDLYEE